MSAPDLWVVGASGLLGSAVARAARRRSWTVAGPGLTWGDPPRSVEMIDQILRQFRDADKPARIAWCAGSGVTSSGQEEFAREREMFSLLSTQVARVLGPSLAGRSELFLASSFGGVFAGAGAGPHDEFTPVAPLSDYGRSKIAMESAAQLLAQGTGCRVVAGRITNLFGPGQNLTKGQGLVSTLMRGALRHQPVPIYVPLDTVRDYLFVDDAAELALNCLDRARDMEPGSTQLKVLGSMQRTTIAALIAQVRRLCHGRLLISQGGSSLAAFQARDLSASSRVWTDLDDYRVTLVDGLWRTWLSLNRLLLAGEL